MDGVIYEQLITGVIDSIADVYQQRLTSATQQVDQLARDAEPA